MAVTLVAWGVVLSALSSLAVSAVGLRAPQRVRAYALVIAIVGVVVVLSTRSAWEVEVRRPLWVIDVTRGRWLARGAAWTLSSLVITGAAGLREYAPGASRRAWWGAFIVSLVALSATVWASLR